MSRPIEQLAALYQKPQALLCYSGTLALELALKLAGIKAGDRVALSSLGCYKVALAIARLGAIPVFISPSQNLLLDPQTVAQAHEDCPFQAIILVHFLGLPLKISAFRKVLPAEVKIIEDAAQAWRTEADGEAVGSQGEILITSFGPSKPLSFGIGGAVMADSVAPLEALTNLQVRAAARAEQLPEPYQLDERFIEDIDIAVERADDQLINRQMIARRIYGEGFLDLWPLGPNDKASWHRIPIFFESREEQRAFCHLMKGRNLNYQLPLAPIPEMPLFKERVKHHYLNYHPLPAHLLLYPQVANWRSIKALNAYAKL